MIPLSLALFFAQLLVLNCKETLVSGDKSTLLTKLWSVQNGGKKFVTLLEVIENRAHKKNLKSHRYLSPAKTSENKNTRVLVV